MAMIICGKFRLPNGKLAVPFFVKGHFSIHVFEGFDADCVESALDSDSVIDYLSKYTVPILCDIDFAVPVCGAAS